MISIDAYRETLRKHAASKGLTMNPDLATVTPLLEGLLANGARYGYRTCPCRPAVGDLDRDRDIICPCVYAAADIDEYGACYCWLFVSQDWIDGIVQHSRVPERRPPEKTLGL